MLNMGLDKKLIAKYISLSLDKIEKVQKVS